MADTDRLTAEAQLAFLAEASVLLGSSLDYETILNRVARLALPGLADWCGVNLVGPDDSIRRLLVTAADPNKVELARRLEERYPPKPGARHGAAPVLRSGQPELYSEVSDAVLDDLAWNQEHRTILCGLGYASAIIVPLRIRERTLGTMVFGRGPAASRYTHRDLDLAQELALRVALAVDNAQLYRDTQTALEERARLLEAETAARRETEAARQRLAFLAEASSALSGSLDYETTLQSVARQAVPSLADLATVDIVGPPDLLRRVALAQADPSRTAVAQLLRRAASVRIDGPHPIAQVARSGESVLYESVDEAELTSLARSPGSLVALREIGLTSYLAVPLVARGQTLGVLQLGMVESSRVFGSTDLALAEDLGRRAGLAVENARLYREARAAEREARGLYQAALAIGSEIDLDGRLERVLEAVLGMENVTLARVALLDETRGDVEIRAARGAQHSQIGFRMPLGKGLIGAVMVANRPIRIDDAQGDPRVFAPDNIAADGTRSWMGVPLVDGDRPFGALIAASQESAFFTEDDERRLISLGALVAAAVREASLTRQLRDALRARDEFLSVAAHELKTPLTSLRGFAQLAVAQLDRRGELSPELARKAFQVIDGQSDKLANLVAQLLDVSRIEAGKLRLDRALTDLVDIARTVIENASVTTSQHSFVVAVPPSAVALVDPLRIEQVLSNLIDNAIKYSPDGGEIELTVTLPDDRSVRVEVRDHGLGIPEAQRQHIFDRFYQAHSETYAGGMGLGLFITLQIVELHAGQIEVEFPSDGGTRFTVTLPNSSPVPEKSGRPG